ncbi:MAG: hypothetical protein KDA37_06420 [Planctomycetales bacterium]|nr:hypothetical protein [Planctomycetales bacterium]
MRLLLSFAIAAVACLALAGDAYAQANVTFQQADGDFYDDVNSWLDPVLLTDVPSWEFDQIAIINSGIARVSTNGSNITAYDPSPGRIALGSGSGTTGTLIIENNGVLAAKANTTTGISAGNITVGTGGVGILIVEPGGTLTSEGPLSTGVSASNSITVGDATGAGVATISANSVILSAASQVYSNASFNAATTLNFTGGSVYTSEVNTFGTGRVSAAGATTLDGTLNLNFTGVSPSVGSSYIVAEGASIAGNFDAVTSSVSLPFGQKFIVSTAAGGPGQQASATLEEVLVLEVNRNSGVATIKQPGNNSLSLDGYYVASDTVGSLDPSGWTSFASQGTQGTNWIPTANDANTIGEFKATGSTSIGSGGSAGLGSIYDAYAGTFGQLGEDLQFVYTRPSDGAIIDGIVTYTGTAFNTLIVQVDPTTGETYLRNTSQTTVDIDQYDIQSPSGSLLTGAGGWESLDSTNYEGDGTWLELVTPTANLVGEFNALSMTTLAPGATLPLGNAYVGDGSGTRDLEFQFLQFGADDPTQGVVVYEPLAAANLGDFNGDLVVDAADYTAWRDNLGDADESNINNNGDGGGVTASDYQVWVNNFGASYASIAGLSADNSAVPEPASWALALLVSVAAAARKPRT